ncbi:hypothetical protein CIB84_014868, partial [Bambusicola thoracicus]
ACWNVRTGWQGSPESSSCVLHAQEVLVIAACAQCLVTVRGSVRCLPQLRGRAQPLFVLSNPLMKQSHRRAAIQSVNNNSSNCEQMVSPASMPSVMKSVVNFAHYKGLT